VNLLEKQLSTVYFKDARLPWVTLYFGLNIICETPATRQNRGLNRAGTAINITHVLERIYQSPSMQLLVVLSDELQGHMFRTLGGHLQAIKIHTSTIRIATSHNTTESPR